MRGLGDEGGGLFLRSVGGDGGVMESSFPSSFRYVVKTGLPGEGEGEGVGTIKQTSSLRQHNSFLLG